MHSDLSLRTEADIEWRMWGEGIARKSRLGEAFALSYPPEPELLSVTRTGDTGPCHPGPSPLGGAALATYSRHLVEKAWNSQHKHRAYGQMFFIALEMYSS